MAKAPTTDAPGERKVFHTLDGLRGVAALAVATRHAPDATFLHLLPGSYLAVDFFFLLSGFVLCHAYQRRLQAGGAVRFIGARFLRFWPLYILGTVIGAALAAALALSGAKPVDWSDLALCLALGAVFAPVPKGLSVDGYHPYPLDFVTWSLLWELVVNFAFALLAPRLSQRVLTVAIAVGAGLLVLTALMLGKLDGGANYMNFWAGGGRVVFSFFAGVGLYRLWAAGRLEWLRLPAWLVALLLLAVFAVRAGPFTAAFDLFAVVAVFPVLLLAATGEPRRVAPYAVLGAASYALYVLHIPLFAWTGAVTQKLTGRPLAAFGWEGTLAVTLAAMLVALAADAFYDRPLRAAIGRRLKLRRREAALQAN